MARNNTSMNIILGVVNTGLYKGLNQASARIQKFATRMKAVGASITTSFTLPFAAIGAASVKMASDFEETDAKFKTVFSSISLEAEKTAQTFKESFGLSSVASKKLLSDTGDLLVGFGFQEDAALSLSEQVNRLAVDLASFANFEGGAEGASKALTKALVGETESAKALGIVIRQGTKEYKDRVSQIQENQNVSLLQAKALANLEIATDQSSKAIGDFARTSGSFANQTRIVIGRIQDLAVELGQILLPIAASMVNGISNLITSFRNLDSSTKNWIMAIGGIIAISGPLLTFLGALVYAFGFLLSPIGLVVSAITLVTAAIITNWDITKKWITNTINAWIDLFNESKAFRRILQSIGLVVETVFDAMRNSVLSTWEMMKGFGKSLMGIFTLDWDLFTEGLDDMSKTWIDAFTKAGQDAKDNFSKAFSDEKIEYINEDDIQDGVDQIAKMGNDAVNKLKNIFSSASIPMPTTTSTKRGGFSTFDPGGGSDDPPTSIWQKFFANQDKEWEAWGKNTAQVMDHFIGNASQISAGLNSVFQQGHNNRMIALDNEYNKELSVLENKALSADEFNKRKEQLDRRYENSRKALQIKAAKSQKRFAIFDAIINTAAGITKAIPDPFMMSLAAIIGGAQIATIAAEPIPMAKGALAFSPTHAIVGDNPNALNDPEVIAPLSKLEQILSNRGNKVNVIGNLSGQDIVLSSEKAEIGMNRYI